MYLQLLDLAFLVVLELGHVLLELLDLLFRGLLLVNRRLDGGAKFLNGGFRGLKVRPSLCSQWSAS